MSHLNLLNNIDFIYNQQVKKGACAQCADDKRQLKL